ncbi:UDP-glucose 4-epimerase GalE [Tissierella sp. MSJ-40]|uniref:UDP-glucose 4-epimerase n=1 Tax=Tissierella simiarum TaxID=2841534 RepID=A0ABS6E348_9FIRM|nr:UDP-glucose 4-epimerase GalE [Tissierella simiarum]MBU5436689.1 UDP-glucose 4-epimerase GalE [Tissierella simiarum]
MAVLVTGGAGYIGSHTVLELLNRKEKVVVIDNLVKGHREAIKGGTFYQGDLRDEDFLCNVFEENEIQEVIHFAAYSLVGESVEDPIKYYNNNVVGTIQLLSTMKRYGVKNIVFSSTAAVYGEPINIPILEEDATIPTNPYGESKLAIEKALKWANKSGDINYIALRYFNAAGANKDGCIGEDHSPETHLIPIILEAALGKRERVFIYGDDYDTPDGTCIRDYIHVVDLAEAHILALDKLRREGESGIYNLGNGRGFSVKEVIDKAKKVTGINIPVKIGERRLGDPAVLVASSKKAKKELNWNPKYNDLEKIIEDAWNWHKNNLNGYRR